jgi:hypothetical protein
MNTTSAIYALATLLRAFTLSSAPSAWMLSKLKALSRIFMCIQPQNKSSVLFLLLIDQNDGGAEVEK